MIKFVDDRREFQSFMFTNQYYKMLFKSFVLCLVQFGFLYGFLDAQQSRKFFRKDYTYLAESRGFYKIHTVHKTWSEAKRRCAMEGASLFYPEDKTEVDAVLAFWNRTQPFYWVYVGISDLLAKEVFETIDGRPIADVYSIWGPGEPNDAGGVEDCVILRKEGTLNDDRCDRKYPYICKKALDTLEWNQNCDMPNRDYVYNEDLGKCYKFHLDPKNWTEAIAACSSELSYLAIVNSQAEADYILNLTASAKKDNVRGHYLRGIVLLGFHNKDGDGWKTIKGTTLEDSGYESWANQQPDGGEKEQCGSIFYGGKLNDVSCQTKAFFVCEHDISNLSDGIDERFNDDS